VAGIRVKDKGCSEVERR